MFNNSVIPSFKNCAFHIIILDLATIIMCSIINKWYLDVRESFDLDTMYGTDGDEPDQIIQGLLEEHQSYPDTTNEDPFFGWYSVALTQFRVPWFCARAHCGPTLYLQGVMYLSYVRRYPGWTLKRTCDICHMTSAFMFFIYRNLALSPWVLIKKPSSLRMHADINGFDTSDLGVQWCWIWMFYTDAQATPMNLIVSLDPFQITREGPHVS